MKPFLVLLLCLVSIGSRAQINAPDTVCQYDTVTLSTTHNAETYTWTDSTFSVDQYYTTTALSWDFGLLDAIQAEMHNDNGHWYQILVPWYQNNKIVRADMGSDPTGAAISYTDLYSGYVARTDGVATVRDDATGNWYSFVVSTKAIFRYNYGTSLGNTPTVDSIFAPALTGYSTDVVIGKYNNEWTGFFINDKVLIRMDIGTSITNVPTFTQLVTPAGYDGHSPKVIEESGNYYLLTLSVSPANLILFSLGSNIQNNNPSATDISDLTNLPSPRILHVLKDCNKTIAVAFDNSTGNVVNIDFGSSITNTPVYTVLGSRPTFTYTSTSFTYKNTIYLGYRYTNTAYLWPALRYSNSSTTTYNRSTAKHVFNTPGLQTLGLFCNEGNSAKLASFCKPVYVRPSVFGTLANTRDTGICPGKSTLLNVSGYGGASYKWNTGATTPSITAATAGTYWVKVSGALGCANGTDTIKIKNYAAPYSNLGPDTLTCADSSVTLQLVGVPGAGISYLWNNGATTPSIQALSGSKYWLEVTSAEGCKKTDTIAVNIATPPNVWLGNDTALCAGAQILLRSNLQPIENTYVWSTGDNTDAAVVTDGQVYWLEVTDKRLCKARDSITMYTRALPNADLGNDYAICANKTTTLHTPDSANYTYVWSVSGTISSVEVAAGAAYWVMATDEYGCRARDTVDIGSLDVPVVNLGDDAALCPAGKTITSPLRGNGYTYLWSTGATTEIIKVLPDNTYTLAVTDKNGCTGTDDISFTLMARPELDLGAKDTTICNGRTLILPVYTANGDTYAWNDGSTEQTLSAYREGVYTLAYSNQCYTVKDTITVHQRNCDIWFPGAFTPNGDSKNDIARVLGDLTDISKYHLAIYNRWGRMVYSTDDMYSGWDGTYKGTQQDVGTYNYIIQYTYKGHPQKLDGVITLVR